MRKKKLVILSNRSPRENTWYWYGGDEKYPKNYAWSRLAKPMFRFPKMRFHLLTAKQPVWKPR